MDIPKLYHSAEIVIRLAALASALVLVWRGPGRPGPVVLVGLNAGLILLVNLVGLFPALGMDYEFFREAGLDALAGLDPYAPSRFAGHPFLNPPTALPLFAGFALIEARPGLVAWTVANLAALACLPWLVGRWLVEGDRTGPPASPITLIGLAVALLVSDSALIGLYLGQLSAWTALAVVLALVAQQSNRPILAGLALAAASVKVSTMLPFLLIFSKRSDRRTWLALVGFGLVLGSAFGGIGALPTRLHELIGQVGAMSRPGMTNDYSFLGTEHSNMIGFDHLVYRLGLRDRGHVGGLQAILVAATGGGVAWLVLSGRLVGGAAASLVALYSMLFLYHRNYDLVILILPLVHICREIPRAVGRSRAWLATSATAILLSLYLNRDLMVGLNRSAAGWDFWPRYLTQAIVLPYMTWLLLIAMLALVRGMGPLRSPRTT